MRPPAASRNSMPPSGSRWNRSRRRAPTFTRRTNRAPATVGGGGWRPIATHAAAVALALALLGAAFWLGRITRAPSAPRRDPVSTPPGEYAWTDQPAPAFPIPPYACYLRGVEIVLDPGHGGRGDREDWKRGPTGLREAEVNLRVAQFLREFLTSVAADVVLTRDADVFLDADVAADNRRRIELANELNADLFLSIHHNAAERPEANYTALFYHDAPDHSPANLCAARHLLTGLDDALRLSQHLPRAVLSDTALHADGLLVLRAARVPAVLGESSFHSNPRQEERLRDPIYLRREAYGYFLGLARWAQAGLPRVRLLAPATGAARGVRQLVVALDDGLTARGGWESEAVKILSDSLVVRVNDRPVAFTSDLGNSQVRFTVPNGLGPAALRIYVDFENIFGQHVLHPHITLPAGP